jgi:2-polyprenyl-3-methyl-5-hydroxy-6-metoxy-1,4-benzoquinol methylase
VGARYDAVAQTYGAQPDDYSAPATRALLDLAGDVDRKRVLDLACGHGPIARELARRGGQVVGLDLSTALIARAADVERDAPLGITYVVADSTVANVLGAEQFDVVVCSFGLSDIDDLAALSANVVRLLAPAGHFVFSILHPCFPGVVDVSASWPTGGRYGDEGWWQADGALSPLRRVVGANHRTLSTYCNTLIAAGLALDALVEPAPDEGWAQHRPGADALPVYLVARWHRS